jgi:hypothetical protein
MTETIQQSAIAPATVAEPPKKRIRLPGPKKLLARVCQRLERLIETGELNDSKRADCVIRQSEIALALWRDERSQQRRRLQDDVKPLTAENERLQSTSTPTPDPVEAAFRAYHAGK